MDERRRILELVAEGRLTVEEATRILEALEEPASVRPAAREPAQGLLDAITRTIDMSTAAQAIAIEMPRVIRRSRKVKRGGGRPVDEILSFASRGAPRSSSAR